MVLQLRLMYRTEIQNSNRVLQTRILIFFTGVSSSVKNILRCYLYGDKSAKLLILALLSFKRICCRSCKSIVGWNLTEIEMLNKFPEVMLIFDFVCPFSRGKCKNMWWCAVCLWRTCWKNHSDSWTMGEWKPKQRCKVIKQGRRIWRRRSMWWILFYVINFGKLILCIFKQIVTSFCT